jgi:hypothetical protein
MTEKTDPYLIRNSGNITVSTSDGYKPTRREFFTVLALPHVVGWVAIFDLSETTDLKRAIAVAAVNFADKLIKALDENNETD